MSFSCNFSCNWQEVKSFFNQCQEIDLMLDREQIMIISRKHGIYLLWPFEVVVTESAETEISGVTFTADLLFKLPSNTKSPDAIFVDVYDDRVEIKVNAYKISTATHVFDRKSANVILNSLNQPMTINLNELRWLHNVSRAYKNCTIEISGKYAFCKTPEGLFAKILKEPFPLAFGFNAVFLSKIYSKNIVNVSVGDVLSVEMDNGARALASIYKTDQSSVSDLEYALKLKYPVQVQLSLFAHKDLLKIMRGNNVRLSVGGENIILNSPMHEELRIYLGDALSVQLTQTDSFTRLANLTEAAGNFMLDTTNILKIIAQEKSGVKIYMSAYIHLVHFQNGGFILLAERAS